MKTSFAAMRQLPAAVLASAFMLCTAGAVAAESKSTSPVAAPLIQNRTVGYVLTTYFWAMHTTEEKSECPQGLNDGPITQFDALYPKDKKRTIAMELEREAAIWFPTLDPEPFTFKEAVSKVAPGLNLDGKDDASDFMSPDGERGIDNQFYRVIGCIGDYRPGGSKRGFHNIYLRDRGYTRFLIELTDVDSLENDDDVTVTTYRGLDRLLSDASGNEMLPSGTQRVDARFGKEFNRKTRGKIVDGVLTTEPADLNIPIIMVYNTRAFMTVRDSQLKLNVLPHQANGLWGGYLDVESFYRAINTAYANFHHNYGGQSIQSVYRALYRLADAHPDPATGRNTAISGAFTVELKQAFIKHPDAVVGESAPSSKQVGAVPMETRPKSASR